MARSQKVEEDPQRPLTKAELEHLALVARDPIAFCPEIIVQSTMKGKVPFIPYPFQKAVLYELLTNRFNIILKFRQAGITELLGIYALWLANFYPDKRITIISIKETTAKKVLKRIKLGYKNLKWYLKTPIINGRGREIGTTTEIEFANGSVIESIPTTEEAGRGDPISLLIIDEAAIIRWADRIATSALPTLSTGGSCVLNSTPYGTGNYFHKQWVNAISPGMPTGKDSIKFNPIRLRWDMHPERDMAWYNGMLSIMGPRKTAQEIDGDFLGSGNNYFDPSDIRAIEDIIGDHPKIDIRTIPELKSIHRFYQEVTINYRPKKGARYAVGADVSTGRARDYSAASVMDSLGNEVAYVRGKITVDNLAKILLALGKYYHKALLAPEANDIGLAVAVAIQKANYPNLYYFKKVLKKKGEFKPEEDLIPGWYTTATTRPLILQGLEQDIRTDEVSITDPFFPMEASTFVYDLNNRPGAQGKDSESSDISDEGFTDDTIMAKAITNYVRKLRYSPRKLPI